MIPLLRPLSGTALLILVAVPAACAAPMVPLDLCAFKPVFMEDFDTMSIASRSLGYARWIAHTPWSGDFGDAAFTDPIPGGPLSVSDGMLRVTASRSPERRWRSGLIAAGDSSGQGSGVQYGYFEARMKFPAGPGTWPAFWVSSLKPQSDPAPGVEIDTIEYYGHDTGGFQSGIIVWDHGKQKGGPNKHWTTVPSGSLIDQFHTYGLRVAPDVTTFYLDRKPIWQSDTPPELKTPLFPLVDLALGSGYPTDKTPDPSTMLVDYVHVYALDEAGQAARCKAGAGTTGRAADVK